MWLGHHIGQALSRSRAKKVGQYMLSKGERQHMLSHNRCQVTSACQATICVKNLCMLSKIVCQVDSECWAI